jgi:antitoxin (DNA-binding transcriptional repressor) of toxin-antitoxin stability system
MTKVGVREVKDHLSAYLREVRRGAVVHITDRGEVIAELRPPTPAGDESQYERLVADGKVIAPARRWSASFVRARRGRPRFPAGTARELIDADRDER